MRLELYMYSSFDLRAVLLPRCCYVQFIAQSSEDQGARREGVQTQIPTLTNTTPSGALKTILLPSIYPSCPVYSCCIKDQNLSPLLTSFQRGLLGPGETLPPFLPAQGIPAYKFAGPVGMNHADDLPRGDQLHL